MNDQKHEQYIFCKSFLWLKMTIEDIQLGGSAVGPKKFSGILTFLLLGNPCIISKDLNGGKSSGQKNRLVVLYCHCIARILITDYCIGIVLVSKSLYSSNLKY
jgi:hypothetical protein